ncbi:MAG TPA: HAD-IC family P-type ATPase [Kofleriaceae bacterium]|nr:HAD-IC family P-type ATPase [Kofleriaceae bacterium]
MTSAPDEERRPWHATSAEEAVRRLGSDLSRGLSTGEARRRLAEVGPNALPEGGRRSLAAVFVGQFRSPLIYLLLVAAGIAVALGERTDAVVILVVVLSNAVIGTFQEGRAERALAALARLTEHKARALRDGQDVILEAREVVPGDVLILAAGDAVAADARLVEASALHVAEAALTGESVPVSKDPARLPPPTPLADRHDMVFAGTHVTAGRGRAVVVTTGTETEIGRIAAMAGSAAQPRTPLERRVAQFGRYIVAVAVLVFVLVVAIGLLRGVRFAEIFMIGVSTLVGMVPEGLPVAMTIGLAVGVQRMARRRAVVRRLSAVETLGSTTVIGSDKTGTLTRNEMTVTSLLFPDGREVAVTGSGYQPRGQFLAGDREVDAAGDPDLRAVLEAGVLCNDAELRPPAGDEARWTPLGDPTETALLTVAMKGGIDPAALRRRHGRVAELPFDPGAKLMATQHAGGAIRVASAEGPVVVLKGAPEAVLELCATARAGGQVLPLSPEMRREVRRAADQMASRALRLLAIAVADGAELDPLAGFEALSGRATLLAVVGQIDPPREEVARAVKACVAAGIRPVMITGDHRATGIAIARELGIRREGDDALDGAELEAMSDDELAGRIATISVFARVHPAQKLRIVEAYQRRGEVVAMTGDGVNDAPALVRANVGVAMGITGTEVAKDAATIVIADDNFATIVAAVEEGRVVYRNIKKAVLLLFSTSAAEVIVLLLAMVLGYPPPFAAVQILWNNLVTEGVITVNLIMEPAEGDEMSRPPIPPDEPLLSRALLARMGVMVPAIVLATLGWFIARTAAGVLPAQVRTETFTLLAICEWYNVINCRSDSRSAFAVSILRNTWLLGGLAAGIALQAAVVFWTPLGQMFRTVPLGAEEVLALVLVGSLVLWAEEARKLLARARARR